MTSIFLSNEREADKANRLKIESDILFSVHSIEEGMYDHVFQLCKCRR